MLGGDIGAAGREREREIHVPLPPQHTHTLPLVSCDDAGYTTTSVVCLPFRPPRRLRISESWLEPRRYLSVVVVRIVTGKCNEY